jgi:acyl-CoA thioesterase FadM
MLIVMGDVDAAGVLYFGTVFRWHERCFTEWLAEGGSPLEGILASRRALPVRSASADYPSSAGLGDRVEPARRVHAVTETDFVFETSWTSSASGRTVAVVSTRHVACAPRADGGGFVRIPLWGELIAQVASGN